MNENPEKGKIIRMVPNNLREEVSKPEPNNSPEIPSNPLPESMNAVEITLENYRDFYQYNLTVEQKIRILTFILEQTQSDDEKKEALIQLIDLETDKDKKAAWEFHLRQLSLS